MKQILYLLFSALAYNTPVYAQYNANAYLLKPLPDSVTVAASNLYGNSSLLKRLFVGSNYRAEWSQPVTMAVFKLKERGFTITELGGGQQTKSLRLVDKNRKEWVLRTIDKTVDKALDGAQEIFAKGLVQDMISAAHPYAPLSVGYMAKSMGIIAPNPVLYYVPDDPAFGEYRDIFAGKVCFLEEREPTLSGSGDTESTDDVLEEIIEEDDHLVLQKTVFKARLLDMLVADWDRHADQWRWGKIKSRGNTYYYAIPRDRDQAFFMSNGLIPLFAKQTFMRHISRFTKESNHLKHLNYKTWTFDRTFINELDRQQWEDGIKEFQKSLSDDILHAAVVKLPSEIYAISGKEIEEKLKSRRDGLLKNGLKYYRFISAVVQINGKDEEDLFEVDKTEKGIRVQMYRLKKNGTKEYKLYDRTFDPKETNAIYLMGNDGDDQFIVSEGVTSTIKLKIYGGGGKDTYDIKGNIKTELHDIASEGNKVLAKKRAEIDFK